MDKEAIDIQKEIEKYFTESAGFGRDKIQNFMDIVNKALKQKGEQIAELDMKRKAERKIFQGIVEKKNDQLTNERRKNRKLKKENADLKELLSLVYKDLISYKTNPNNLAVEGTFEMEKSVFMDWLHRVKPFVTEGEVKK